MTSHKCKTPDVRKSHKDALTVCSCGKQFRAIRYTCPCGTFGCRDAWQWVGIIDTPEAPDVAEVWAVKEPQVVEDDAAE